MNVHVWAGMNDLNVGFKEVYNVANSNKVFQIDQVTCTVGVAVVRKCTGHCSHLKYLYIAV